MSLKDQGRRKAIGFREANHLGDQPLGDLVTLIEQTSGHDVAVIDAPPDEHGFSMRDPVRDVIFIGVARTKNALRQRFTLAHELAHILFNDWETNLTSTSPEETRANYFANHLLVPRDGLRAFLGERGTVDEAALSSVVQHFLVSPSVAAIALHDAGYIDDSQCTTWKGLSARTLATRHGWTDQLDSLAEEANRLRAPKRLLARTIQGYKEGVVSLQTVATLRHAPAEKVREELESAEIFPDPPPDLWLSAEDLPAVDSESLQRNAADERKEHKG